MPGKERDLIHILVLDDEESIRWVIGKTLNQPRYKLHFAETAEQATRMVDQEPIDFALVDIPNAAASTAGRCTGSPSGSGAERTSSGALPSRTTRVKWASAARAAAS